MIDLRLVVTVLLVAILFMGLFKILHAIVQISNRLEFLVKYREKLVQFLNEPQHSQYQWLIQNMDEAQQNLGNMGVADHYRGAYGSFTAVNYPLLLNFIPKLRDLSLVHKAEIGTVEDSFMRADAALKNRHGDLLKEFRNPLKWLTVGISQILTLPLFILQQFGVISRASYKKLKGGRTFRIFTGVVTLFGAFETIGIWILGKSAFIEIFHKFF